MHRWGGLYRDVEIEATPDMRIDNIWVRGDFDKQVAEIHATVTYATAAERLKYPVLRVKITAADVSHRNTEATEKAAGTGKEKVIMVKGKQDAEVVVHVPLKPFKAWSPEHPHLYLAEITLCDGDTPVHGWTERFGVRKLEVRKDRFFLNNQPFLVRGFGDDYIYPLTLCSPAARATHRKNLGIARRSGFNYVRHHTHTEIPEFYDAADELGILVQPELPYYGRSVTDKFSFDPKRDLMELIKHCRRYVSLATYSMGNEGSLGTPLDNELYQMAKQFDPDRWVIHQDGGRGNTKDNSDFRPGPTRPWSPGSFGCDAPYVAHEYLNLGLKCDPRLDPSFSGPYAPGNDLKTYEAALSRVELSRAWGDACMDAGHALQYYYQKQGIEMARLDPTCDGYSFWTIVDVLCKQRGDAEVYAGQGLYNPFWEPKTGGATPENFRTFNGPTALLAQPDRTIASAGEVVGVPLWISHFGKNAFQGATLKWALREGGHLLDSGSLTHLGVAVGGIRELGVAKMTIPELTHPVHAVLEVHLQRSAEDGEQSEEDRIINQWGFWLFPKRTPRTGQGLAVSADLYPALAVLYPGIARVNTPEGDKASVLITTCIDSADVKAGRRIVLIENDNPRENVRLGWWWIGNQAGTAMAKHPVFGDFPHSGRISPLWFRIIKNAASLLPDDAYKGAEPLMVGEGILGYSVYLAQARLGQGRLLRVNGIDLFGGTPESASLLDNLLDYARSDAFAPKAALDPLRLTGRWKQRQDLHTALDDLNGWSRTRQASGHKHFAGHGPISVLGQHAGKNEVAWETCPVASEGVGETVTFNWMHGSGFSCWSTAADHHQRATLHFNDKPLLTFALDVSDREWTVREGDTALRYRGLASSRIDAAGLMSLIVPRALLNPCQTNVIKLVGEINKDTSLWSGVIEKKFATQKLKSTAHSH